MKSVVITDKSLPHHIFDESVVVDLNNIHFEKCTGGLKCLKSEGECYFKDDMNLISRWINQSKLVIFVSKVVYGEFDILFKQMIERSVVNQEPYYSLVEGETLHLNLSQNKKTLMVIGYGDISKEEEKVFLDYLKYSPLSYAYHKINTYFCNEDEIAQTLKMFGGIDHE